MQNKLTYEVCPSSRFTYEGGSTLGLAFRPSDSLNAYCTSASYQGFSILCCLFELPLLNFEKLQKQEPKQSRALVLDVFDSENGLSSFPLLTNKSGAGSQGQTCSRRRLLLTWRATWIPAAHENSLRWASKALQVCNYSILNYKTFWKAKIV
jgi:hypothetical protein